MREYNRGTDYILSNKVICHKDYTDPVFTGEIALVNGVGYKVEKISTSYIANNPLKCVYLEDNLKGE